MLVMGGLGRSVRTALLLVWSCPVVSWACKCGPSSEFDPFEAPLIFVGEVKTVERVGLNPQTGFDKYSKACFDSDFSLYGVPEGSQRVCVVTSSNAIDCHVPFQVGEHYMVFAGASPDAPDAGLPFTEQCWGTSRLRRDSPAVSPSPSPWVPAAASLLVGFAVGLLVRARRRK